MLAAVFGPRGRLPRLAAALAAVLALGLGACDGSTDSKGPQTAATKAPPVEMRPGDMVLGDPDAPVTVIEYSSLTCPHCAAFHANSLPAIKEKFIDTGKVRFIFREFPTPPSQLAAAGFLLARCAGEERYFQVLEALFARQEAWVYEQDGPQRVANFRGIAAQVGVQGEALDACLQNAEALEQMRQTQIHANEEMGVSSTPSFVIGGRTVSGVLSLESFEELVAPYLPAGE